MYLLVYIYMYSGILFAPDTVWTLYRRENWLLRKTLFDNYVSPAGARVITWENRANKLKKIKKQLKRETRHTERQCPARTWTNFLPEKHLRLFRHFFRSWQATARPPKPFLPFGVCVNSPGERHLATSSHALNRAKIEQRVPKLPVRLQMSESNRLGAGTWLGGRAGHNFTRNLRWSAGVSEKAPFMSKKSSYRGCQCWEKDPKWSKSAATSYNPGI